MIIVYLLQLQVLDPKNKGPPTCKCPDCVKKSKSISRQENQMQLAFPKKSNVQKNTIKKNSSELKTKISTTQTKKCNNTPMKNLFKEELFDACESYKVII